MPARMISFGQQRRKYETRGLGKNGETWGSTMGGLDSSAIRVAKQHAAALRVSEQFPPGRLRRKAIVSRVGRFTEMLDIHYL